MKTKRFVLFILSSMLFVAANAQDTASNSVYIKKEKPYWFVPSYLNVQYAGNMGFLSACAGYFIYKDKLYLNFGYGYTPYSKAGTDIHNAIVRIGYKPFAINCNLWHEDFVIKPIFADFTVTKQIKSRYTWQELPNYYPDGYYHQNAVRMHINFGASVQKQFTKFGLEAYYCVTTNDVYITYFNYYHYNHWIHWHKIFSSAIGVNIYFF